MNSAVRRAGPGFAVVLFLAAFLVSWSAHGTGVVKNDIARNIPVPNE